MANMGKQQVSSRQVPNLSQRKSIFEPSKFPQPNLNITPSPKTTDLSGYRQPQPGEIMANVMDSLSSSKSASPLNYITGKQLLAPKHQEGEVNMASVNQLKAPLRQSNLSEKPIQKQEESIPNQTGLPDNLKAGIENLSGYSLDNVRVHYNSSKPAQLQALAYTQGTDIHVAPGQDKHLPHEAWHVVQQMQGRVKPILQAKGVAINDDSILEQEADLMGIRVTQMSETASMHHSKKDLSWTGNKNLGMDFSNSPRSFYSSNPHVIQMSIPETWKEYVDPSRWRINPYWWYFNRDEQNYEAQHNRYHSRERHGAEHTLQNIHARTLPGVWAGLGGGANPSAMVNIVNPGRAIPMFATSSRFSTPAWHTYSRNKAITHIQNSLPGVVFPVGAPPGGIPGGNYHTFNITYPGASPGLSVTQPGTHTAQASSIVFTGVQHDPITNQAWIIQHFPRPTLGPQAGLILNSVVPYNQIPWFSTQG